MEPMFVVMLFIGALFGFTITKHTKMSITAILIFMIGFVALFFAGYDLSILFTSYEAGMSEGLGFSLGIFLGYFLAYKAPENWWGNKPKIETVTP